MESNFQSVLVNIYKKEKKLNNTVFDGINDAQLDSLQIQDKKNVSSAVYGRPNLPYRTV